MSFELRGGPCNELRLDVVVVDLLLPWQFIVANALTLAVFKVLNLFELGGVKVDGFVKVSFTAVGTYYWGWFYLLCVHLEYYLLFAE